MHVAFVVAGFATFCGFHFDPEKCICYVAIDLSRTQDSLEHLVEMLPCLVSSSTHESE
jgi:hypothetical protein